MRRRFYLAAVMVLTALLATAAVAEEEKDSVVYGWQTSLIADLTTTQTAYSDSWVGGEAGSFNWVGNLNGTAENQVNPTFNFRSTLKMSFGQTMTQDAETKDWSKPRKSTDLIDWESVARFTFGWHVDPYAAFRLETQFLDASVRAKDRYLTPMRLTESAGFADKLYDKGDDEFILTRLGVAVRQTITKDIVYGVEGTDSMAILGTETNTATDGGIESVTDASLQLNDRLKYVGKLTLFKALFFSQKDDFKGTAAEDYWKAVDVNFENIVHASISKIISVNFYLQFVYDKQVHLKGRLKETLGIGFVFKLV